jgi:hypothetical protein
MTSGLQKGRAHHHRRPPFDGQNGLAINIAQNAAVNKAPRWPSSAWK